MVDEKPKYGEWKPANVRKTTPTGLCAIAALFYVRRFLETKRLTW